MHGADSSFASPGCRGGEVMTEVMQLQRVVVWTNPGGLRWRPQWNSSRLRNVDHFLGSGTLSEDARVFSSFWFGASAPKERRDGGSEDHVVWISGFKPIGDAALHSLSAGSDAMQPRCVLFQLSILKTQPFKCYIVGQQHVVFELNLRGNILNYHTFICLCKLSLWHLLLVFFITVLEEGHEKIQSCKNQTMFFCCCVDAISWQTISFLWLCNMIPFPRLIKDLMIWFPLVFAIFISNKCHWRCRMLNKRWCNGAFNRHADWNPQSGVKAIPAEET